MSSKTVQRAQQGNIRQAGMLIVLGLRRPTRPVEPEALPTALLFVHYRISGAARTLRDRRSMRIGPSFTKIGKAVLYPLEELDR
jgi:hypothetical protein